MSKWENTVIAARRCCGKGEGICPPDCPFYSIVDVSCEDLFAEGVKEHIAEEAKHATPREWVEFKRSYDDTSIMVHAPSVQSVTEGEKEIDLGMDNGTDLFVAGSYEEVLRKLGIEAPR